jgi:hypothetical protein
LIPVYPEMHLLFLGGNTFNHAIDKRNGTGYAIGQGFEISFKMGKIAKVQSLGDALCEAESSENKLEELRECLEKTRNERKRRDISANISLCVSHWKTSGNERLQGKYKDKSKRVD